MFSAGYIDPSMNKSVKVGRKLEGNYSRKINNNSLKKCEESK